MEGVPAALTAPRSAAEEDGAGAGAFDHKCQKSQQRQMMAIVAAVATRAGRGRVTLPFYCYIKHSESPGIAKLY